MCILFVFKCLDNFKFSNIYCHLSNCQDTVSHLNLIKYLIVMKIHH